MWHPMTEKEYRKVLSHLMISQGEAARMLGLSIRASHGYANGAPIPISVAVLLRLMVLHQVPVPTASGLRYYGTSRGRAPKRIKSSGRKSPKSRDRTGRPSSAGNVGARIG